ncbi:MAG: GGDEF domain-containing protein [Steroidobacteraceae bacterium]
MFNSGKGGSFLDRLRVALPGGLAWLCLALPLTAHAQRSVDAGVERAEEQSWLNPQSALQQLGPWQALATDSASLARLISVQTMIYVDDRQDANARSGIERLQVMARSGNKTARFESHLAEAYLLCQQDDFDAARRLLQQADTELDALITPAERYRLRMLDGTVFHSLGQLESSVAAQGEAIEIAQQMQSPPRITRAMLQMALLLLRSEQLEQAEGWLSQARALAVANHDEGALSTVARHEADIADRRGQRDVERKATRESLRHAENTGSRKLLAVAYTNLADSYMKSGDYRTSLDYSRQALVLARAMRRSGLEQTIEFNIGIATIGLGQLTEGKRLTEAAIQKSVDSNSLTDVQEGLDEYADALERAGQWRAAVAIHHRGAAVRKQLMDKARQQALLELSARFEDERKMREIELLRRDNALQSANLRAQHLQRQTALLLVVLIAGLCAVLAWAYVRSKRVNARLRYLSEHDPLTGLRNRRFFNESILAPLARQPFRGCLLLVDLDHFKLVNDRYGHAAGDHVLATLSQRLGTALRSSDQLVRWGGEEFLALLEPMSEENARATAQRLLDVVRQEAVAWHGAAVNCTISVGYASFPIAGANTPISLNRAISLVDKALYYAKQRGRNRACHIRAVRAHSDLDLSRINADFDAAAADRSVDLDELENEAA